MFGPYFYICVYIHIYRYIHIWLLLVIYIYIHIDIPLYPQDIPMFARNSPDVCRTDLARIIPRIPSGYD